MSDTQAPDGPTPLPSGAPTPYTERLDQALLQAWITEATAIFADLLTGSTMPADWPRDQAWPQTALLSRDARLRITALLAGNLPPDPLAAEVNRLCGLLDTAQTDRALLRITLAETQAEVTRLQKELMTARTQCSRISATLSDERVAAAKAAMRTDAAATPTPAGVKR